MKRIEEVDDALTERILQVELFTLSDLLPTVHKVLCALVDVLEEVLSGRLQKEDLVVVVAMMGQVATFLTDELIVQTAVSYVCSAMIWTQVLLKPSSRILLVGLRLLQTGIELLL